MGSKQGNLVFEEYQRLIESILFDKIIKIHPDFDAELFINKLQALDKNGQFKEQELSDIMLSFTDFQIFKNLVLQAKKNNLFIGGEKSDDKNLFNYKNITEAINAKENWT